MSAESSLVWNWEGKFLGGDHSDDGRVLRILKAEVKEDGEPLLFWAASSLRAFVFLKENGVNLTQKDVRGRTILTDIYNRIDLDAYGWLAAEFASEDAIDAVQKDGNTPLSVMIKISELKKARLLLENGASIHTLETNAKSGGARVETSMQAVTCIPDDANDDQTTSIEALKLLQEFSYAPSRTEAERLIEVARMLDNPLVAEWIAENLLTH